jgi:NAD(P)-dependent dehydrogenase (short-subunit alcohol dehydrogenase family)
MTSEGQGGAPVFDGKVIVITGAGSGVGRASALAFAACGAHVVCADVNNAWAEETARQVLGAGGTALGQLCDVTKEDDVVEAIRVAVDTFGRLDIMFNNAGVATPRPGMGLVDHTFEDWERLVAINLRGVFFGMKHSVAQFRRQGGGGVIVNTGSVAGIVGWGGTVYGATKGGVNQMTKGVAIECAAEDIRVNAICPAGMPFTNFMAPAAAEGSTGVDRAVGDAVAQMHPLGRPITAEDCAAAAMFLASDEARNITGVLLPIDGGYVAR